MRPIDIFHIGPQKSGTTWLYENLKLHPEIAVPKHDTIHYFDIHFARGQDWLAQHFDDIAADQKIFDPTFTTIRSLNAIDRIHAHNPKAKIALTLRNPIDRAWSHYWHESKKGTVTYPFEAALDNYDLFQNWIEPGLPVQAIKRIHELFGKEQLFVIKFEDMRNNPNDLLCSIFDFYGVDKTFKPTLANKVINAAGGKRGGVNRIKDKLARRLLLDKVAPSAYEKIIGRSDYNKGVDPDFRKELEVIVKPDVKVLEQLTGLDLSYWSEFG